MKSYSPKKMCFMVKMNDIIPRTNKFDKTTAFKTKKGVGECDEMSKRVRVG